MTATARGNALQASLWGVGETALDDLSSRQNVEVKRLEVRGYRGFTAGGIFLGKRDDSVMVRGSSEVSQGLYERLYAGEERYTITRLDIQVTGKFKDDRESYGRSAEKLGLKAVEAAPQERRGKVGSIRGNGRGDTVTFGSRSSQRYLRCYDKTREQHSEIEPNLWRWEVEFKQALAQGVADNLALAKDKRGAIVGTVASEFLRKGVSVPWQSDKGVDVPTTGVGSTDDGRRLKWLAMQVRPVVLLLVEHVGLDAVLAALGLDELIDND